MLGVQRQPGSNAVAVVDAVRERLPTYRAALPASVNLEVLNDRSISVRESVEDVQITLGIAVALVVLVIFLFLRSASATIIPTLAVPVSLIGTAAAMYALGFSINNMTLLALTLVGRVRGRRRDRDAREHRAPHRERHAAVRGRAQGRQGNRLHHHLDHVLADRGVHPGAADGRHGRPHLPRVRGHDLGRDHHFRLCLADADADAVRARAAASAGGREAELRAARLRGDVPQLAARLRVEPRQGHQVQGRDAGCHHRHAVRHRLALHRHPEGILPERGHRLHLRVDRSAGRTCRSRPCPRCRRKVAAIIRADRAVQYLNSTIGPGGPTPTANIGRIFVALKPRNERQDGVNVVIAAAACGDGQCRARPRRAFPRRAEPQHRRASVAGRIPVHDDVERHRYALSRGAGDAGQDRRAADGARRQHRPRSAQSADEHRDRPREGGRLRHLHRSGAPGTVQRLRLASGRDHLHAGRRLSR